MDIDYELQIVILNKNNWNKQVRFDIKVAIFNIKNMVLADQVQNLWVHEGKRALCFALQWHRAQKKDISTLAA